MSAERAEAAVGQDAGPAPDPSVVTFFMVGCQRTGSTWVYFAIKDHPEIFLPAQKQTYFFDSNYEKGLDWYMKNFRGVQAHHRAVGEVATSYCLPDALPHLAHHFPHVKLMMSVRNPVERAYSYYQSRAPQFGWRNMREAVEDRPEILRRGEYIDQIEGILEHYDADRFLLMFYDDLKANDRTYLSRILGFLGVDPTFESPQFDRVVQIGLFPRLRRRLRRAGLGWAIDLTSRSFVGDALRAYVKRSGVRHYRPIDAETKGWLIEHYRPFNDRLAAFAGRDLSHWSI